MSPKASDRPDSESLSSILRPFVEARRLRWGAVPGGVVLLAGALLALPARADEILDRVNTAVRQEMAVQKVPGVAVAIVRRGAVLLMKGYGEANVEHHVPVRAETIFQSGSVGKQFTSAAVMLLVEEGKVSLEDPITKWFPDAPESWKAITVRRLLTHTSGIPDYEGGDAVDLQREYTEDELARIACKLKLEFTPGTRWNYSNTGYMLLGLLIHKASGRTYGELLEERIFRPLGMKTARIISDNDIVPNRAAGYRLVEGQLKNQEWVSATLNSTADGCLYFSVLDMVAWDKGLREGKVLSRASWDAVYTPVRLASGKTYPYGFAWFVEDVAGQRRHHHGGAWQGFKAYISRWLGDDLSVIVLANLADARPERFVEEIAAVFDPKLKHDLVPIPDLDPAATARLRSLLTAAGEGKLNPSEFLPSRAAFLPAGAKAYEKALRPLGAPVSVALLERKELGDDRIFVYEVAYATATVRVRQGIAPDDRLSDLSIRKK